MTNVEEIKALVQQYVVGSTHTKTETDMWRSIVTNLLTDPTVSRSDKADCEILLRELDQITTDKPAPPGISTFYN
jgi:hypothetical protein